MITLGILKIIGIALACIVGFALLIIIMFLVIPFRYKIIAKGHNANTNLIVNFKWLFGFINFNFSYIEGKMDLFLRIVGINLFEKESKEKTPKGNSYKEKAYKNSRYEEKHVKKEKLDNKKDSTNKAVKVKAKKVKKERPTIKELLIRLLNKIKNFFIKLKNIKTFISSDITKRAVKKIKLVSIKLLRHLFPKQIIGSLKYGLIDPATTALTYGLFAGWAEHRKQDDFIITPDFEENGIITDLKIYGRLFTGFVLICLLQLFFNKDIKKMIDATRRIF